MHIGFGEVMDVKRGWTWPLWGLGMLVLILDSPTALDGASEGVVLCLQTLIPGLFPFFVLSGMLTAAMPRGGLMLSGILGGYPVGARNAAESWRNGQLSKEAAERMAVLCNCPGPAFIFGVAGQLFTPAKTAFLWGIYLTSVAILWLLLPKSPCTTTGKTVTLPDAMQSALRSMASVCSWVVLMRTVLAVLDRWVLWLLPGWGQALTAGLLELTNGMVMLGTVEENLRFILAAGMLGFGGICVALQTTGVTQGLSLKLYFPGKVFQGCICTVLSAMAAKSTLPLYIWAPLAALALACGLKLRKIEKSYGNLSPVGV